MSRFNFFLPDPRWVPEAHRPCLLVTDSLETPIPSQIKWEADQLSVSILDKETEVGCRVHALVATATGSAVLLPTVWLFPQWRPYRLELELLRGLISRLRRGCEMWENNGLPVPDSLPRSLQSLTHGFISACRARSVATPPDSWKELLDHGLHLLTLLPNALAVTQGVDLFQPRTGQRPESGSIEDADRMPAEPMSKFGIGVRVDRESALLHPRTRLTQQATTETQDAANARAKRPENHLPADLKWVAVRHDWKDWLDPASAEGSSSEGVADCPLAKFKQAGQRVIWGPALSVQEDCLPADFKIGVDGDQLIERYCSGLRRQLPNVADHCQILHLVGGINAVGVAGLTPTIQYNLVRAALESTANVAPQAHTMISFSQPLGERLGWSVGGQHPDQFLSKLAKERVPIHVIGLELDVGYFPFGTLPRDPLQWVMELQRWSVWGVPILIFLRVPSRGSSTTKRKIFSSGGPIEPSPESQQQFLVEFGRLLSALPWIHGLVYNQWSDEVGRFEEAGLVDAEGSAKPLLRRWLNG